MIRLVPLLLMLAYGLLYYRFSVWQTQKRLTQQSTPLDEPELAPLLARLAQALEVPHVPVHVYEIAPVNGLAAPDGRIFLTRGFLDLYAAGKVTGEELASVVAHELGHVALGHSRRRMIDFSGQNAVRLTLGMVLSRLLPGIGIWIANMIASLLAAKLSRQDEFEADEYAAALMTKAGFGTRAQRSLLAKLGAGLNGPRASTPPAWLLSHPPAEARIAAVEAHEARWG